MEKNRNSFWVWVSENESECEICQKKRTCTLYNSIHIKKNVKMKNNINIGLYIIMRNVKMQCNDVNKIKKTKKITGSFSLACVVYIFFLYLPGSSFFCHSPLIFFLLSFVKLLSSYYLNIKILIQYVRACKWWDALYNFYNIMMTYRSYKFIEISNMH